MAVAETGGTDNPRKTDRARRQAYADLPRLSLRICAALVQNPANLGGLCRTAEAFRLEALAIADLAMLQLPAFRNLAASSQQWQPLWQCDPAQLLPWLAQQQQQGYCCIALDCAPSAIPLDQFQFPARSVLVLGRELTGIPPEVKRVCDRTVTIPLRGMSDSLNVQTAAAIAIYEYDRQIKAAG